MALLWGLLRGTSGAFIRGSLGAYRRPTGTRARTTASRPAPVSTTASYDPQSKYKATLQRLLRDDTVKQAKATKA